VGMIARKGQPSPSWIRCTTAISGRVLGAVGSDITLLEIRLLISQLVARRSEFVSMGGFSFEHRSISI
jgi:hypothetical protein